MKTKLTKIFLLCGLIFPLMFGVLGCNNNQATTPSDSEPQEPEEEKTTYNVTLNQGEGYNLIGASIVNEGSSYNFSITINDGYDASEMVVKCNDQVITGYDNNYVVTNVHENLNITVEGIFKQSKITLKNTLYRLEKSRITQEDRNPDAYLVGVSGSYRGENCQVAIDLSDVNFDEAGTYVITYYLVGHENIKNYATVEIYELPTIDDITLDLSDTYVPIVSYEKVGQVHIDFEIQDSTGHVLNNDEVKFSSNDNINYLTTSYCRTLNAETSYQYKVVIEEDEIPFTLNVTDNEEAKVLFTADSGIYACTPSNPLPLPTASIKSTSAQNVSFQYLLNGEIVNPETFTLTEVGDYEYVIKVIHNNVEVLSLQKNYEIHVIDSYDITDDVDINGSFLFYNADIFSRYFVGELTNRVSVTSTDATNKQAKLSGSAFIVSTEIIEVAKSKGFNLMKLTINAETLSGDPITSIPYVSQGTESWQAYWDQNNCDGLTNVILDLDRIDLEACSTWFIRFGFRTADSNGVDVDCDFVISDISFEAKKPINNDWGLKNSTGVITETTDIDEHTFQAKIVNISYDWHHVTYSKVHEMYEAGYVNCTIQVSGNNHNVFVYANNEAEITDYNHKISAGGGTAKLTLSEIDTIVAVMTSHENENVPGKQDEDGVYGKAENLTITITFSEPRVPTLLDKMYTDDAWTSTGSLNYNFNDGVDSTISTDDTWSLLFSTSYANELYEAGYRTMTATFTVTKKTSDYLTTVVNGLVTSYKNDEAVYTLSFLLESLKASQLRVRTNSQDVTDGNHNASCTDNGITISNITVSNEEDTSIIQAQARRRLSKMFNSEPNCWNYFRHNGWGNNSWGPDCNQAIFGTLENGQPHFTIQNSFFQDMKLAGYTKFSFHVKAEWTDGGDSLGNITVSTAGGHLDKLTIYQEFDGIYETDFSFDVEKFLNDMNENDFLVVQFRGVQPGLATRSSIITLSSVTFSE